MKRLNIGPRLMFSFAAIAVLMLLGSAIALWQFRAMRSQARRLDTVDRQVTALLRLHGDVLTLRERLQAAADARAGGPFIGDADAARASILARIGEADRALRASPEGSERHRPMLDALAAVRASLVAQLDATTALAGRGDWPAVHLRLGGQMKSIGRATADLVAGIDAEVTAERVQAVAGIQSVQRQAHWTLVAAAALSLLAAGLLGIAATRSIVRPLARLDAGARALAHGDFHHRVPVEGRDELSNLSQVFNETSARLEDLYAVLHASLKEKEVLLKEVHHRVKNNLQIVSSLLNMQVQRLEDVEVRRLLEDSRNRVQSMALIHEWLCQSNDLAEIDLARYIESLTSSLAHSFGVDPARVRLKTHVTDISLGLDVAVPCALLVNELVSNALEHAFPQGRGGEIHVGLQGDGRDHLILTVADDGVGLPSAIDLSAPRTMGLELVTTLAEQLDGTIELTRDGGTRFRIRFPDTKRFTLSKA